MSGHGVQSVTVDAWKVIDLVVKGVGAALITGAVALYGHRLEQIESDKAEQVQRITTLVEITSKQKELDVNLAMRMFETLLSGYLRSPDDGNQPEELKRSVLMLRLVALNFQDVPINLKPLFEQLDARLAGLSSADDLRAELRGIAQEVARRQAFRMTFDEGFDSNEREVRPGDKLQFPQYRVALDIHEVNPDGVKLAMETPNGKIGPFTAGYFDSPLLDNAKIDSYNRAAVVLLDSGAQSARIRFVAFPSDLASDRFDIKEIARALQTTWSGEGNVAGM